MMGGEQSHEQKEREEETEKQESDKTDGSGSEPAAPEDTAGELPQCQMGNRKVDNMCFMISCTNWY